ncbi:hypothetical protein RB5777 [Rhodopirellula baltica SH 1]|uniref:Uncharacterized protein n=1 Tax=Rhodopirellula baltica (strain DSM 10527 / NCIMB 13988 / SH1) TaxID=243090 RepID=Q7URB1_RHOBA|nr:hypothetical protein RB5777 [Rhodopirellula baltica SH 1]
MSPVPISPQRTVIQIRSIPKINECHDANALLAIGMRNGRSTASQDQCCPGSTV